jgi:hypothetical protein
MAQDILSKTVRGDLREEVAELKRRLSRLEGREVQDGSLDTLADDGGELGAFSGTMEAMGELTTVVLDQAVVGDIVVVSKGSGSLAADVSAADTSVDFGRALDVGDWVKMQGKDSNGDNNVEWMLIDSLLEGTTYNVTRDVDGNGADTWSIKTPFAIIGQEGDSRIELVAGTTASIRLITQGAAWDEYVVESSMSTQLGAIVAGGGNVLLNSLGIQLVNAILNGSIVKNDAGSWDISHTATIGANVNEMKLGLVPNNAGDDSDAVWSLEDVGAEPANLLTANPGFEGGNTSGWTSSMAGSNSFAANTTNPYEGTYQGNMGMTVATGLNTVETASANRAVVTAGVVYRARLAIFREVITSGGDGVMTVSVEWYDGAGVSKGSTVIYSSANENFDWTLLDQNVTAPTGATRAGLKVSVNLNFIKARVRIDAAYIGTLPNSASIRLIKSGEVLVNGEEVRKIRTASGSPGSMASGTSTDLTITFPTAFADANYRVSVVPVEDNNAVDNVAVAVRTKSSTQCVLRVRNNAAGTRTPTIDVIAVHD